MKKLIVITSSLLLSFCVHSTLFSQTVKYIGIAGDYATLFDAIEEVNNGTITGEIVLNFVSNVTETSPTIILPSGQGSASYTSLTIRPEAQNIEIAANFASPIVTINGAENISIDGRIGSIGSDINLTIKNTGGTAILIENDASNNTIQYCYLKGSSTSTTEGIITVSSGAEGCNNNLIHNCRIGDETLTSSYGIYSVNGGGGSNSNITISNSTIFNFGIDVQSSAGIYLDSSNDNIIINENHIFQTNAIILSEQKYMTGILSYSSNNITISDNFIGGENAGCAGNPWSVSGSFPATFKGIFIDGENTDQSTIQGNTIKNFTWEPQLTENTLSSPGIWCGIYFGSGIIDISNNVIGSSSHTGEISIHLSGNFSGTSYGMSGGELGANISISENEIGGINVLSTSTDYSHSFTGIENVGATEVSINNNTIGSTTTSQSIATLTQSTCSAEGQNLTGIINSANTTSCSIESNTVANLYNATESNINAASNNAHQVRGIAATNGVNQIVGNTIYNLSTRSSSIDSGNDASVMGISVYLDVPNQIVSNNLIYNLTNTSSETNLDLVGLYYFGASTGSNVISNNTIYNLIASTTNSSIKGIEVVKGRVDFVGNFISLGSSISEGVLIHGISKGVSASANLNFYYNSVLISGDVASSTTANTYAFFQNWSSGSDEVYNNIFMNTRTITSGTGKNYAYYKNNTDAINLDYNCYYVTGTGTVLGIVDAVEKTDIPMITGLDQNSMVEAVSFTDPANGNLHTSTTALNGKAIVVSSVTTDIDGNTRNPLLPDIGADEFTQPVIFDPGANLNFGWTDVLTPTTAQSYDITAIDLTANLVITAPSNFQVSLESESNFASSVSISPVNTNVEATIYARYLPNVEGFIFGDITNAGSGEEATVHVQGSARVILPVMETGSTADLTAETISCNAQVTHTGGRSVIDRGVIYWEYDGVDKEIGDVGVTNNNETGSFEAGEYSMAIEGLDINSHYNYRAHGNNGEWDFGGIGYGETADFWTLANVPNAPTVSDISSDTVNIAVNENLNPAYTEFAIYETTTNRYIQADGSMNTNPVWQTKVDWGTTIVTLFDAQLQTGNRTYSFKTIARNGAEAQTSSSEATSILTLANTPNPMWVANPTQTTMDVATYTYMSDYSENSTGTLYAIKEANIEKFVQNDGTLATDTVWNTRDDWGSRTVTGLSIATQCSFSSIATNDDGVRTEPGPATSLYTLAAVPGKLSFTNITSSSTDIEINASTNPTDVEFAVSLSNGQYVQADGTIASGAIWQTKTLWDNTTVSGLAPNTNYTFLVKARNGDNVETNSSEAESIVTLAATPIQPDLYNYNTFTDKLEFYISYDTNPQSTEFAVQDSISGLYLQSDAYLGETEIWQTKASWQAAASYILGLSPGTKYAIRVKARNDSSIETEWGISKKLSTMPNVPGTPVLSDTTTNSISVEIDNSSNPSNVTYAIYENNSSLFVKADGTFSDTEIWQTQAEWGTISISNLNVNQPISLKVKAKNDDNAETSYSPEISVYTLAKIPAAPTVEALSSSSISIAINSNENPGSVFFAIQEVTTGKYVGFYSGLQEVEDWRTIEYWQNCTINGLEATTEYTFRVKARNSDYVETDFGPEASATTPQGLPAAPTLLTPDNNTIDQQIPVSFSWQEVDGATNYDIEYSIYPDFSIDNHSVEGLTNPYYEASDMEHSYTYYWHVRANNEAGTGPWSDRWIFTTISGPPETPTLQSPTNESIDQPTSLSLVWNQVNNATDYYIQVALDNEFTNLEVDESYGYYNFTLNNLENGTTYYWRVAASNNFGMGDWSDAWWFTTIEGTNTPYTNNSNVNVYPNPAGKVLHLTGLSGNDISVLVISELGIIVLKEELQNGQLNIQSIQPGIYLLRIESSQGITVKRFIKE